MECRTADDLSCADGLFPGSTFFSHRQGVRRAIVRAARVRRAQSGLRRAIRSGGVFHLWTHPFNLANDPRYLLGILDEVFRSAAAARDKGTLSIETMGQAAERLAGPDSP